MTVLYIDIQDGARGSKDLKGFKFVRIAIVKDPTPQSGRLNDAARIFEAIEDEGIPDIGDSHPSVANCQLDRIECIAIEPNWLKLELIYRTWSPNYQIITVGQDDISMESSIIQTETTFDKDGNAFSPLSYTWPIGAVNPHKPTKKDPLDDSKTVENFLDGTLTLNSEMPVAPLHIPARLFRLRKRMLGTSADELEALNEAYQGNVNNATWRTFYGPRTWLCMGLTWRTTDRRTTYNVDVVFQYKFDTYDVVSVFKDPFTGKVPADVFNVGTQPNAAKVNRVQREADFDALINALGITL